MLQTREIKAPGMKSIIHLNTNRMPGDLVVTGIPYHNICEVGEGPRVRAMLSDFYLGRKGHKNSDFGIEPYDLNETLCVGRS